MVERPAAGNWSLIAVLLLVIWAQGATTNRK